MPTEATRWTLGKGGAPGATVQANAASNVGAVPVGSYRNIVMTSRLS